MMHASSFVAVASLVSCACGHPVKPTQHVEPPADASTSPGADASTTNATPDAGNLMPSTDQLTAIRNDNIKYATYTPPADRGKTPPGLYRQVFVLAPPEAVALTRSADMHAFDVLVPMLDDPDRNWAAAVMLSTLTGHFASDVIAFENAESFKGSVGERDARKNWETWLAEHRANLQWDAERHQFRAK
jgi:hypothetical protein